MFPWRSAGGLGPISFGDGYYSEKELTRQLH